LATFTLFFCGFFRHDTQEARFFNLANEKQFDCVGKSLENGKSNASGVLIAPKYVHSAAHILHTSHQMFSKKNTSIGSADPRDFQFEFSGKIYQVKRFIVPPDLIRNGISKGPDLVLAELENEVNNIVPAKLNREFDEIHSEVTGVGYGVYGIVNQNGGVDKILRDRKTAGRNVVDVLFGITINDRPIMLSFDFDSPTNAKVNKSGDARPVDLEYTAAGGDSGGGLFRTKNNKWELIGILHATSGGVDNFRNSGYYGDVSEWTRVSVFMDWIEKEVK
jgi:secreted trypsin-like serine protease